MLAPNMSSQVAAALRRRILTGQLAEGAQVMEVPLAKEFGISRGPIRDALLTLSKEGLLTATPNVGVRVAIAPDGPQRELIVRLRREIETTAARLWIRTGGADLLDALDKNLDRFRLACAGTDLEEVVELDMSFHRTLVASVEGGALVDLWTPIVQRMLLRYSRHRSLTESYEEHREIVEALRARSIAKALAALRRHIQ